MPQHRLQSSLSPRRQPFLYLTAALVAGILIDRWMAPTRSVVIALAAVAFGAWIASLIRKRLTAAGISLMIGFASCGALLSIIERTSIDHSRLYSLYESGTVNPDDPVELTGVLSAPLEPAPGAYFLDIDAESIRIRNQTMTASGRARLMVSYSDAEAKNEISRLALDYGSRISVLVRLERARAYANPGSPDFNDFLQRQGYDLKGVIKSPLLIERLGDAYANPALSSLYHLRLRAIEAIDSHFNRRVAGTLKAMLVGNRYYLDQTAAERLREGSTFHTLSISGMHIGIIAWALLGWQPPHRRRGTVRVIVCLAVLWAYAIMVGLSAPVSRATAMITIGLMGPLLFRRSASINTVALAAFVMLALEPALVADPAFQLSFIAVAGIVGLALPIAEKLRAIGQWRPGSHTPHPPSCLRVVRYFAETLFWDERAFKEEMRRSPIRYRLEKARAARLLGRWRAQGILRGIVLLVITSACIQLTTLPLMALYFNRAAPIGVLLNVIAGLLTAVLMLTALGAIAVGTVSTGIAAQLAHVVYAAHYLLVNAIAPFTDIPLATFRVAHYEGWQTIIYALYFLPLAMLAVLIDRWRPVFAPSPRRRVAASHFRTAPSPRLRVAASFFCALALTSALAVVTWPPSKPANGKLTLHFLDVGQGDSALVIFPRGKKMLVDGGGELRFDNRAEVDWNSNSDQSGQSEPSFRQSSFSIGEAVVSRFVWSLGRTRVDYVLATHAHADHIGGLTDVLRNVEVGQAIVGHAPDNEVEHEYFVTAARQRKVPLYSVSAGERFEIDGVSVEVLWPPPATGAAVTADNNDSVVLRLIFGSVSILLAGDIEQAAEDAIVNSGVDLRADVLKVPHHGSRTSSSEAFINTVKPRYGVISVAERSRFGHPHPSVVNRYLARDVKLLETGRDGMVTVETDGLRLDVRTFKKLH